jgi:hypothetical protein
VIFAATSPARCRTQVTLGTPGLPKRGSASRTFFLLLLYRLLGPVRFIQNGVVDIMLSSSCLVRRHRDDLAIADDLVLPMKA